MTSPGTWQIVLVVACLMVAGHAIQRARVYEAAWEAAFVAAVNSHALVQDIAFQRDRLEARLRDLGEW